ncbi:hypothetical protein J2X16_004087 [Pelomonas aquatica]|uniref:DUF5615 domain-containing protein n=1 Tax=Pelomonas aquatica TaxID=431058 RepID=A0ABU1ZDL8_9BURK|nr:hypothetical protein [Pelomonas aquatica]MDR7298719.1 hypothetical protein [Pelomonas aquatica]
MKLLLDENLSRRLVPAVAARNDRVLAALLDAADRIDAAFADSQTGVVVVG